MAENTRDRILDAGLKLFSEKGYLGTTTKEISEKAGVAEITLFRHFSSKESLFGEIINTYTFLPALKGLLPKIKNLQYKDSLDLIAHRFLERLTERRELIRIMHAEMPRYPAKVRHIYHNFIDEIFRTLASYFRELQDRRTLRRFNPETGARAFLGMFFAYFNAREFVPEKTAGDTETVITEFVEIFIKGTLK